MVENSSLRESLAGMDRHLVCMLNEKHRFQGQVRTRVGMQLLCTTPGFPTKILHACTQNFLSSFQNNWNLTLGSLLEVGAYFCFCLSTFR